MIKKLIVTQETLRISLRNVVNLEMMINALLYWMTKCTNNESMFLKITITYYSREEEFPVGP